MSASEATAAGAADTGTDEVDAAAKGPLTKG